MVVYGIGIPKSWILKYPPTCFARKECPNSWDQIKAKKVDAKYKDFYNFLKKQPDMARDFGEYVAKELKLTQGNGNCPVPSGMVKE